MTLLPACPLMHGTGGFTALECLSEGGRVVTLTSRQFDPVELLDTVMREQVNALVIVGDVFAKPILASLDAHPGRWDLTSLVGIISSGVMWSEATKQGLLGHYPGCCWSTPSPHRRPSGWAPRSPRGLVGRTARFTLGPRSGCSAPTGGMSCPAPVRPGCSPWGVGSPRLLQGRRQVGRYVPGHRRCPLLGARRLRRGGCGRLDPPAG